MSEVREGYKITELGQMPVEWDILRLDELSLKITDGSHSSPTEIEESDFKICSVKHMKKDHFDYENALPITEEDYMKLKNNGCNPIDGDVLLSKDGTIGKTFVFKQSDLNIVLLSSIAIIRCNKEKLLPYFLKYFIENPNTILKIVGMKSGSAIKRIVLRDISNLLVVLPEIKEQEKIASILSTVDEQIDETEQLIVKTKELKKGLIQQLLTKGIGHTEFKQTELGEIPVDWEIKCFEDIMQHKGEGIRRGPFGGALKKEIFVECGYAVYEQQHVIHNLRDTFRYYITEEKFTELKSFEVLPGDILISCSGTVGKVLIVPEESPLGVINQALLRLRPNLETDIHFLYYLLTSDFVQKRMLDMTHGSALKNMVSIGELKSILLAIPNNIEEQQKIASILSTVDEQIEVYEQEKAEYEELKKGLMQQLLTGQIRVKI